MVFYSLQMIYSSGWIHKVPWMREAGITSFSRRANQGSEGPGLTLTSEYGILHFLSLRCSCNLF